MKYFVRVGDAELELVLDGETVTLDGRTFHASLEEIGGSASPIAIVRLGDEVHRVLVRRGEEKGQYDLSIDAHRMSVEALDERTRTIRDLSNATRKKAGPANLVAPMPGLVVRLNVQAGDQVRAGQGLVVMEAMKMENELRAAANGTVKQVLVAVGSAVEKGALLLEMEPT